MKKKKKKKKKKKTRKKKQEKKTKSKSQKIKMSSSMFSNDSYKEFMKNHKAKDGEMITHTRIGDVEKHNVYPAKYHIPAEDLPEFYELYKNFLNDDTNNEYLTEKQLSKDPVMCVDFDFRYENTVQSRQHDSDHIRNLIVVPYMESLMEFCDFPENCDQILMYIMEKKKREYFTGIY